MTTYRVTWTEIIDKRIGLDEGESFVSGTTDMVEIFTNIDHGYDRYQRLLKAWWASNVTWEHVHD